MGSSEANGGPRQIKIADPEDYTGPGAKCAHCDGMPEMVTGARIYPHRGDLHHLWLWLCPCGAYCGTHPDGEPLGICANAELRRARQIFHDRRFDPLWQKADRMPCYEPEDDEARRLIRKAARGRAYAYLAERLGLTRKECHTAKFDLEECRRAWRALEGVTAEIVRTWHKNRPIVEKAMRKKKRNKSGKGSRAKRREIRRTA